MLRAVAHDEELVDATLDANSRRRNCWNLDRTIAALHRVIDQERAVHEIEVKGYHTTIGNLRRHAAERGSHRAHIRALQRQLDTAKANLEASRGTRRELQQRVRSLSAQLAAIRTPAPAPRRANLIGG